MTSMLKYNIDGAWVADNNETLNTVIATMNKNNIRYTRYAYEKKGGFWDQTISKKGRAQVQLNNVLSNKEKYGGRIKVSATYFSCVEHGKKNNRVRNSYHFDTEIKDGKTTVKIEKTDIFHIFEFSNK